MNIFDLYLDKIKELVKELNKEGLIELPESLDGINVDIPPANFKCDMSSNVAMVLSKSNKKSPLIIAEELIKFINNLQKIWKNVKERLIKEYAFLSKEASLCISPSDFGFHNSLYTQNNNLIFHDFEYFGWDDPVKLISDFSHNAAMNLTKEIEQLWFSEVSEIYGKHLLGRLSAAWPMYGLNWCLIILNEFKDELWNRRIIADDSKALLRDEYLSTQLAKSKNKLNALALIYKNKFFW